MIKLMISGKIEIVNNKKGLEILQKNNPKKRFKIATCKATKKSTLMVYSGNDETGVYNGHKGWLCLHDA